MSALRWDQVRSFFDPELMGALPDLVVEGTDVDDWHALLGLIHSQGWECHYYEDGQVFPLPNATKLVSDHGDMFVELHVKSVRDLLAIFRPWRGAHSIDFDIDVREVQGQERLDILCAFLEAIGRRLRKPVLMMPEGRYGHPILGFDVVSDRVVLLTDPPTDHSSPLTR